MAKRPMVVVRKPPNSSPAAEDIANYVRGESVVPNPEVKKPNAPVGRRGVVHRADGTEARRLGAYVSPEIMQSLRVRCLADDVSLSKAVSEALGGYLQKNA